jgi:hypothetical protein
VLFDDRWPGPLAWTADDDGWVHAATPMGTEHLRTGTVRTVRVGGVTLRDVPAAVARAPDIDVGDGLLPTRLFERVHVSNSLGYVILTPPDAAAAGCTD